MCNPQGHGARSSASNQRLKGSESPSCPRLSHSSHLSGPLPSPTHCSPGARGLSLNHLFTWFSKEIKDHSILKCNTLFASSGWWSPTGQRYCFQARWDQTSDHSVPERAGLTGESALSHTQSICPVCSPLNPSSLPQSLLVKRSKASSDFYLLTPAILPDPCLPAACWPQYHMLDCNCPYTCVCAGL